METPRQPLQVRELGSSEIAQESASGCSSSSSIPSCVPRVPILKEGLFTQEGGNLIADCLRRSFAKAAVNRADLVTESDFIKYALEQAKNDRKALEPEMETLLRQTAGRCYREVAPSLDGMTSEGWIHFGLLLASAPSHLDIHLLNRRLRLAMKTSPNFLKLMLDTFERMDVRGYGVLRLRDLQEGFADGTDLAQDLQPTGQLLRGESPNVSYYDWSCYCLGCRKSPVLLNWYDLSHGLARWVPPAVLGGLCLKGIWHTGIVAFGKEYWYGGKVLSSEPGTAPFPPGPAKTTHIGTTLCNREELEEFLRSEMAIKYNRERYDVLTWNCNHFSDEVAGFLCQGFRIPDEARKQPEYLMNSSIMPMIRMYLNQWLGGFEAGAVEVRIDDLMGEWRDRLRPGDNVLLCPYSENTSVSNPEYHGAVRVAQLRSVDPWLGTCALCYFQPAGACLDEGYASYLHQRSAPGVIVEERSYWDWCITHRAGLLRNGSEAKSFWDWSIITRTKVPLAALRPNVDNPASGLGLGPSILSSGLQLSHRDLQKHLLRRALVYAHCPQGHSMQAIQGDASWGLVRWLRGANCGICSKVVCVSEFRMGCKRCRFSLCSACDRQGLSEGYYSLGPIDNSTASGLLKDPAWLRYKAQRYLFAAGVQSFLQPDTWWTCLAPRLYADLGLQPPGAAELLNLLSRYPKAGGGSQLAGGRARSDIGPTHLPSMDGLATRSWSAAPRGITIEDFLRIFKELLAKRIGEIEL